MALIFTLVSGVAAAVEMPAWLVFNSANPAAPESILSTDILEKSGLVRAGWKISCAGVVQSEAVPDSALVYRMVRQLPKGGVLRMLVTSKAEENALVQGGYLTEGALGYVSTQPGAKMLGVCRYTRNGKYLWLVAAADQQWALKNGWTREKVVFWLWPEPERE